MAEDFQVDEVLNIPLSGNSQYLWLWVEKSGLNTEEAVRRITQATGVPLRALSYARLKDRQALTYQWLRVRTDLGMSGAGNDMRTILKSTCHKRRLQRGACAGKGFTLRLKQLAGDNDSLVQRFKLNAKQGVPHYFSRPRFRWKGVKLREARDYAACNVLPGQHNVSSRPLSTTRTYLFNQVLVNLMAEDSRQCVQVPDLVVFANSRSVFQQVKLNAAIRDWPFSTLTSKACGGVRKICQLPARPMSWNSQFQSVKLICVTGSVRASMRYEHRILCLATSRLMWHCPELDILQLKFSLPTGCFTTVLVCALVELMSLGQTDSLCVF